MSRSAPGAGLARGPRAVAVRRTSQYSTLQRVYSVPRAAVILRKQEVCEGIALPPAAVSSLCCEQGRGLGLEGCEERGWVLLPSLPPSPRIASVSAHPRFPAATKRSGVRPGHQLVPKRRRRHAPAVAALQQRLGAGLTVGTGPSPTRDLGVLVPPASSPCEAHPS